MIVTVTLNPALHVQYAADTVELGRLNRVSLVRHRAAGRGLAVARLLHTFGHDVVAAGLAGGSAGELIRAELAAGGVATQFTPIGAESPRVVEVSGSSGPVTSFAEPAPYITTEELGRLAADYRALLDGATAVVLCGTLPAGLPSDIYASLTSYARQAGVPVVVDASGEVLALALARRPELVVASGGGRLVSAVQQPVAGQQTCVAVPTQRGVRVLTPSGQWRAELPPDPALSVDRSALVAGFVPGIALSWSWPDMLAHAVALAGASSCDGTVDISAYESLLPVVSAGLGRPGPS